VNNQVRPEDVAAFFSMIPIIIAIWTYLCSVILTTVVANSKKLEGTAWFLASLVCGPLALLAVIGMPNRSKFSE